jgi:hypothetical protein
VLPENRPLDAVPPRGRDRRRLDARLWPFTYETDPAAIRAALVDYERVLKTEREVLAWALKGGRRRAARGCRAFIDHVELRRRNGLARLARIDGPLPDAGE